MKKITAIVFIFSFLTFAGCSEETNQTSTQSETTSVPTQVETNNLSYIYPNRDTKVGDRYGEMTLQKISEKPSTQQTDMYAYFKGEVTVSGTYEFMPEEGAMGLDGKRLFYSDRYK